MIKTIEKYPIASIFAFVFLMLGLSLWVLPVSIMEARNFIAAREMLQDDNWILTTMNGEARYQKPPLPTWITAFFGSIFGITKVWALRLPAILLIGIIGSQVYLLSKQLQLEKAQSLRNAFVAVTSFYIIGIVVEAPWDIYAHGFTTIALCQLFMLFQGRAKFWNSILFAIMIAATVLSKGPVSLYALFLPFVLSYVFVYKFEGGILRHLKWITLLVFGIAIGGLWYLYVRIADPETFTAIASKETGNWSSYNVRPFYYYWSFFTQSGLWTIPAFVSLLYPYLKSRVSNLKAYKFSLFWTLFAVILLSIVPEKKSRYLMPVLIPLAINIGFYLEYLVRSFKSMSDKKETYPVYFNFGLIGLVAVVFPILAYLALGGFSGLYLVLYILASICLLILGFLILKSLRTKDISKTIALNFLMMLTLGLLALPLADNNKASNYKPIAELDTSDDLKLHAYSGISPEAIWNYGSKIPVLKTEGGLQIPEASSFLLAFNHNETEIPEALSNLYRIELIGTFDLNTSEKNSRSYKERLVNKVYKLTRR
ncbi:glycosyltransferase [Winogradskyella maritima]|uniref:ArnT family glycosyltransferase n=1 Tax=Winogradskyella maritima TaxID=1517766 RepID=A0ABV8AJT3_9FLAO|nr:glycosyltransferase [Winogradskyella maritima]